MESSKEAWLDYLSWIIKDDTDTVFRGHSSTEFKLKPSIGRDPDYSFEKELQLFEHFKNQGRRYIQCNSDLEWLASAQHHGLPTRLLDWTYNPLVALYFAVKNDPDKDGVVYFCQATQFLSEYENPFDSKQMRFYLPPSIDERIKIQRSIFSIHGKPDQDYSVILNSLIPTDSFVLTRQDAVMKHQYIIPSEFKSEILNYLNTVNINPETVFGGIDGLAEKLQFYNQKNLLPLIDYKISKQNLEYRIDELQDKIGKYLSSKSYDTVFSKFNDENIILNKINADIQEVNEKSDTGDSKVLTAIINCNFIYKTFLKESRNSLLWAISKDEYYNRYINRDKKENDGLFLLFESITDEYLTPIVKASRYSRKSNIKCNISINRRSGNLEIRDISENKEGPLSYYHLKLPIPDYYFLRDELFDMPIDLIEAISDFWEGEKYNDYYMDFEEEQRYGDPEIYQNSDIEDKVRDRISEEVYEEETIECFIQDSEKEIKELTDKITTFHKQLKNDIDESVLSDILFEISETEEIENVLAKNNLSKSQIMEILGSD